ncbi:MAG: ABC transporter ATP-binding protein [Oscillospiraceae bacterium]
MSILTARQLVKSYSRGGKAFDAVRDASLSVEAGTLTAVIGRSGSGKSTLLNLLAGFIAPTAGSVLFDGADIAGFSPRQTNVFRRRTVGFVPQGKSLLGNLTVLDNVRAAAYFAETDDALALPLLEHLGIGQLAASFPAQLSGGELRRAAIARALVKRPAVVFADEPTNDLDAQTAAEVITFFKDLTRTGTAVVLVTHDKEARASADQLYEMQAAVLFSSTL